MRQLLILLLLLFLPTFLYAGLCLYLGRKNEKQIRKLKNYPWVRLISIGLGLVAAALLILALTTGYDKDSVYIPAHMDGDRLVPAQTIPGPAP